MINLQHTLTYVFLILGTISRLVMGKILHHDRGRHAGRCLFLFFILFLSKRQLDIFCKENVVQALSCCFQKAKKGEGGKTDLKQKYVTLVNFYSLSVLAFHFPSIRTLKSCVSCLVPATHSHTLTHPPTYTHTLYIYCLLYTSPSPRDGLLSRMPSSA